MLQLHQIVQRIVPWMLLVVALMLMFHILVSDPVYRNAAFEQGFSAGVAAAGKQRLAELPQ